MSQPEETEVSKMKESMKRRMLELEELCTDIDKRINMLTIQKLQAQGAHQVLSVYSAEEEAAE